MKKSEVIHTTLAVNLCSQRSASNIQKQLTISNCILLDFECLEVLQSLGARKIHSFNDHTRVNALLQKGNDRVKINLQKRVK